MKLIGVAKAFSEYAIIHLGETDMESIRPYIPGKVYETNRNNGVDNERLLYLAGMPNHELEYIHPSMLVIEKIKTEEDEEYSYQNQFLSEYMSGICDMKDFDDNVPMQELAESFADSCMELRIEANIATKLFKSFWSYKLREVVLSLNIAKQELLIQANNHVRNT